MNLAPLDILIIAIYLSGITLIGVLLKKEAQTSKQSYMLGGNKLPWYLLGLSNATGMFDISGTVWLVTMFFVYGLKSIWMPWLWPVFNQIFLMVYLSVWLRRSGATTGAEWMATRFGTGRSGHMSRMIVVVFAIVMGLGYLTYGFIGLGKFIELFIPWNSVSPYIPFEVAPRYVPHVYGIFFTAVVMCYVMLGGMMSVVWADLVQYIIMGISSLLIGGLAMLHLHGHTLNVPEAWHTPWFGWSLNMNWSAYIPEVEHKVSRDGFSLFTIFFMMMVFKGVLSSMAGPAPTGDLQKIFSTRNEREAALMSGSVSVILMPVRYFMVTGFVVLGLLYYNSLHLNLSGHIDFEQVLPAVIHEFIPVGLLGLLLAGLLAAFVSTFASIFNAAQSYLVNDLFLNYIHPEASRKQISWMNYIAGVLMISLSIFFGFFAEDVNDVLQWIVSGLYGSYVASNLLKWYWWRFNGTGYFWGMAAGMVPAFTFRFLFNDVLDLYTFPLMLLVSFTVAVVATYMAPPVEEGTLKQFYKSVRPWGFWGAVHRKVLQDDPAFVNDSHPSRDLLNVLVGIIWQMSLVLLPVYIVLLRPLPAVISGSVAATTSVILYFSWYRNLPSVNSVS